MCTLHKQGVRVPLNLDMQAEKQSCCTLHERLESIDTCQCGGDVSLQNLTNLEGHDSFVIVDIGLSPPSPNCTWLN